jgi:hypothetical protein
MIISQVVKRNQFVLLMWAVALGLVVWTVQRQPRYELNLFQTPAGWGYQISRSGVPVIYQPTRPGMAGHQGFDDESQARRVGERVLNKVRRGQFPPTLQPEELE